MIAEEQEYRSHDHVFGQDRPRPAEKQTLLVVALTACTMILEIVAGLVFGSMALLADGLHMASHALALSISVFAYVYARRHARDDRFSFGTGKVNALGGFAGAILLGLFALLMGGESVHRFFQPIAIAFDQAIVVAIVGLLVNGASVVILGRHGVEEHGPSTAYQSDLHHPADTRPAPRGSALGPNATHRSDHNLRAAYLHVLADALTSLLAIIALVAGKFWGLGWLDPAMGCVGAILVAYWAVGLLKATSRVLLDHQSPRHLLDEVRSAIEHSGRDQVTDLHIWSIGPSLWAAEISIASDAPQSPSAYRNQLPSACGLVHVTIEVHGKRPREAPVPTPALGQPEGDGGRCR